MSFKWNDDHIPLILDLLKDHPCLWDQTHFRYRDKEVKIEALKDIVKELNIPTVTIDDVKAKIKTIRAKYSIEIRKVRQSIKNGEGNMYIPKVFWFQQADSFLGSVCSTSFIGNMTVSETPKVNTRNSTEEKVIVKKSDHQYHVIIEDIISNAINASPTETYIEETQECEITENNHDIGQSQSETTGMIHNNKHSLEAETEGYNHNIGQSQESKKTGSTHNIGQSQESETSGSNHNIEQSQERATTGSNHKNFWKNPTSRKRSFLEISSLEKVIDKLWKKSKENNVNENEFDYFGKSISLQLKQMPLDRALICQEKLQKVMTEERLNQQSGNHQLLLSQQSSSEAITQILFPANYIQGTQIMIPKLK